MGDIADFYSWGGGAPGPDDLEIETDTRIYKGSGGKPTCSNCESENIKRSKAGNLYCADLCWVEVDTAPPQPPKKDNL